MGTELAVVFEGIRALLLIGLPLVAVVGLFGILAAVLQGSTTLVDPAFAYAIRLLALLGALYVLMPAFTRTMLMLTQSALQ